MQRQLCVFMHVNAIQNAFYNVIFVIIILIIVFYLLFYHAILNVQVKNLNFEEE